VTAAELLGFVTGAASVWLTVLARIGNFPTVLLRAAHDIAPFWDALTTAISLAAQFLLNAKKIENWAFWIAADLVYVPLYMVKRLDLTALVYLLFLGSCGAGVTAWRRALRACDSAPVPAAAITAGGA
jgi:nicotinamide mononucleotide transporter